MTAPVPFPPKHLGPLTEIDRSLIADEIRNGSQLGRTWLEKLRRFASLSGSNLRQDARTRFGVESVSHLKWMANLLMEHASTGAPHIAAPIDQALLNSALYCLSALGEPVPGRATEALSRLENWLKALDNPPPAPAAIGDFFDGNIESWTTETDADGIVILCPSPFSLLSLSVFRILHLLGVDIRAVVIRKFTLYRVRHEWRRDGIRLVRKIWRKLVLKGDENPDATKVSLKSISDRLHKGATDIRKVASEAGVPVISVDEFEDAIPQLEGLAVRAGIFTGGGMLRGRFLEVFPDGIINVHMGPLPQYKGMDVVQAPILEGNFDGVSLTAHLMEERLDAGAILARFTVSADDYPTLGALRNELSGVAPILAVDAMLGLFSGRLVCQKQSESGRQYYFVHPQLSHVIDRAMLARYTGKTNKNIENMIERFFFSLQKAARHNEGRGQIVTDSA